MTDDRTPDPDAPHALEQHGREPDDRRGELIAAALADDLSPAETAELDAMRAADPTIDEEIALLGGLPAALGGLGSWQEAEPSDELARRVGLIADGRGEVEPMAATTATTAADGPADLDAHRARRAAG
ncbi:hypothetical protein [Clavibacter michiganensis]|uniref:hypothetical protein n=1 Tax=Clavibacter michiganensis TaxID=28447 RepID=UPI000B371FB3|nr:hypothetical protein [Clavibacter michiganensis]OUD93895.1 hypothetical protein CMMCAS04_06465 [Clavibacter michiganensis subsp. michiganensis]